MLDEPGAGATGGGAIAAPAVGRIFEDVLPYLGYEPQYTEENAQTISVSVPNITGLTVQEATDKLQKLGLSVSIKGSGNTVTNQSPEAGTKLHMDSVVIAYTDNEEKNGTCIVPSVVGMTYVNAQSAVTNSSLVMEIDSPQGSGTPGDDYIAVSQSPQADSEVAEGTKIYVKFAPRNSE